MHNRFADTIFDTILTMRFLLYIAILFVATACSVGNSYRHELDRAQSEMEHSPDKALERLNAIDVSDLSDSATIARWALLYSEAINRNRLAVPSDTIINIAVDYYRIHGDSSERRQAEAIRSAMAENSVPESGADPLLSARYLQKVREYTLYRERQERRTFVCFAVVVLAIAIAIIVWLYSRLRLKKAETDALLAEAASLRGLATDNSVLRDSVAQLFGSRFELIDRLCGTYYESQGTKVEKTAIVSQVKAEIEAMRADSSTFARLENAVNEGRGQLLVTLRTAFPDIKHDDYALAVYLACGFSNRAIALLLEEKIDVIYKRKSRLKAKIAALPAEYSGLLASIFADGQKKS